MLSRSIGLAALSVMALASLRPTLAQPPPARVTRGNDLSVMAREPFQIFDNLYFVGIGEVGSYVVSTSAGLILIDTLWDLDGYTDYLLGQIRKVGLDPMDIKYVLILQGHRDHYGGAPALQRIINAQFGTAAEDKKLMEADFGEYAPRIDFIIEDGGSLTLGDTTLNFEITPGHTPGTTSLRFPVFDHGVRHSAYFHGGPSARSNDPAVIRRFITDLERIKRIPGIDVQIGGHYDSYLSGTGDLFDRAARLAARKPGEPHPWVAPEEFQAFLDERIGIAQEQLKQAQ
jgi:glyoxylase-like metal-dependent hydrolase (beta-lactamase superfamily II)